ncbi:dermonecrotic toxin domain-containing protein [Pandoraea sp. NPDC090278]|uniref:dermonecrotic toxin domain-containing protein n=1 Tax=Pandoraea sp. NPDC090278 TaxID=3364391 RepID=UPI00383ACAD2
MIRSTQFPLAPVSLPTVTEPPHPACTATAFPPDRSPTLQTLLTASLPFDAPYWADKMTQICEDHPALSTSLRWFLGNVPLAEIAQFLDSGIEVLADALDDLPDLAHGILISWENALARRHPAESLEAICLRVTSPSNLRDVRRSMTRAAARDGQPENLHVAVCGKSWAQSVSDTFQWLRMAGSGFDPNLREVDYERRARELAHEVSCARPTLRFYRRGAIGTLTGLLYAYASASCLVRDIGITSHLSAPHRVPPDDSGSPSFREVIGDVVDACLNAISEGTDRLTNAVPIYDPLRFPATASAAIPTTPRDIPNPAHEGVDPPHHVRHASHHPSEKPPPKLSPLDNSPAMQRVVSLANAQENRALTREAVIDAISPILDLRQFIDRELISALADVGITRHPDLLYLNRFKYFGRPSKMALPPGTLARSGLIESLTLSEAARQFATKQNAIKETPLAYGIYRHNRTLGNHFVPEDEVDEITIPAFERMIDACRQRWLDHLNRLEGPRVEADYVEALYERARTALEQQAAIEYNAGRISGDGLVLAQIVAYASDTRHRRLNRDAYLGNIRGHEIIIDINGRGHVRPAGAFAISEYPARMTRHPGRVLVAVLGSGFPLREYESELSLERDLARGEGSVIYRELVGRLPLDMQPACFANVPCQVMLPATRDDVIRRALRASFSVIHHDFDHGGSALFDGRRSAVWTTWLAGANATDFDTGIREAAPGNTGFPAGFPPDTLPRERRLHIDRCAIEAVHEVGRLRVHVAAALPDLPRATEDYMTALIKTLSGQRVATSQTYLHVYRQRVSTALDFPTIDWTGPETPIETLSLAQYLANRVSGAKTEALSPGTRTILSNDANPVGARELNIPNLTPEDLLNAIDTESFIDQQTDAFDTFWQDQLQNMYVSLKGAFIIEAFVQQQERRLPSAAADIARRVAGCASIYSLDLEPMHIPSIPDAGIRMSWLHIGGAKSDIQIFEDVGTGWLLVYAPRVLSDHLVAFHRHAALHSWLTEQLGDTSTRERLVSAFSAADRDNAVRTGLIGVPAPRRGIIPALAFSTSLISGDPFTAYLDLFRARVQEETHSRTPSHPGSVVAPLLDTLAATNFVFGLTSIAGAALPGIGVTSSTLSAITFTMGATAVAFGDPPVRSAGWNAMLSGAAGLPIGWFTNAAATVSAQLRPFLASASTQRLHPLMPNLYRGEQGMVVRSGDLYFNVDYFPERGTWNVIDHARPGSPGPSISQTANYDWILESTSVHATPDGLVGATVFHDDVSLNFIEVEYRSKLSAQRHAASAERRKAFLAGRSEAGKSPLNLPPEARPSALLKLDFIDSATRDPRLLGILSRRVEEVMRVEATARAALNARLIAGDIRAASGEFRPLPQMAYTASNADGRTGFCLPLVRMMAVAQHRGDITSFIQTIEGAVQWPQSPQALSLREQLVRLHSSVEASAAETHLGLLDLNRLEQTIEGGPASATYLVTTRSHSMSISVELAGTVVYDPNFGVAEFRSTGDALKAFGALMRRGDLARLYGAFDGLGEMQFILKRVDVDRLARVDVGGTEVAEMAISTWG